MRIRGFEKVSRDQFIKDYFGKLCTLYRCPMRKDYILEKLETYHKNILIPRRATRKSSGYDFVSPFYFTLSPNETVKFPLGIKTYMQEDEELLLFPRSSIGFKYKIKIDNTIGKIDSDFYNNSDNEGDIHISLTNTGDQLWEVKAGDKICQGSFYKYLVADDDCPVTEDRVGGIGSTNER